jgi:hypothetical protein
MLTVAKAIRICIMLGLVAVGVSLHPSEAHAGERDYICGAQYHPSSDNLPAQHGGGYGGTYGWTEVLLSTSSCNLQVATKIFYCSTGATAPRCQKSNHNLLNSVALVQFYQRAYSGAVSTAMQATYPMCACRNDPQGQATCAKPIEVTFKYYSP